MLRRGANTLVRRPLLRASTSSSLCTSNYDSHHIHANQQRSTTNIPVPSLNGKRFMSSAPSSSPRVDELIEKIIRLDVIEVHLLTERVQEKLGKRMNLSASDLPSEGQEQQQQEEEKEKTKFDLRLQAFDAKSKIKVIKEVRAIAGLGLKEAKELVEGAPKIVKKDMKKEEAEELKAKLEQVGATIEIV